MCAWSWSWNQIFCKSSANNMYSLVVNMFIDLFRLSKMYKKSYKIQYNAANLVVY